MRNAVVLQFQTRAKAKPETPEPKPVEPTDEVSKLYPPDKYVVCVHCRYPLTFVKNSWKHKKIGWNGTGWWHSPGVSAHKPVPKPGTFLEPTEQ